MKVTSHAVQRWQERVSNVDNAEQEILNNLNEAQKIWSEIKDNKEIVYYLKDDVIFVVNDDDKVVITIVKADYGFSDEINKTIVNKLLGELNKAKETKEHRDKEIRNEISELQRQLKISDIEIETLQAKIKSLEAIQNKLRATIEALEKEAQTMQAEIDGIAKKLIYSIGWRLEELTSKNKKRKQD